MRVLNSKPILMALLGFAALSLAGCGKSRGSGTTAAQNGYSNYPGMPGMPGGPGMHQGGCAPIMPNSPIPIALQGAILDSANLVAGPGQAVIGGAGAPVGNFVMAGQGSDAVAQIGLQLQNLMQAGPSPVTGQGVVMITPLRYQVMLQRMGGGYMGGYPMPGYPSYPGMYPQPQMPQMPQLCASGVVINLGHYNTRLYGGTITLLMNGGQYTEDLFF